MKVLKIFLYFQIVHIIVIIYLIFDVKTSDSIFEWYH